jgi:methyltransferase (TIGR00027 family)
MANEAANTGIMPTALVAIEQCFPKEQRVVEDALAYRMLPLGARFFVRLLRFSMLRNWLIRMSEKSNPGIWGGLLCRKRYIDDKLVAACTKIDAVVNLGAGFDTRAYRLSATADLPVWEVDQRMNVVAKEKRLHEIFGKVPSHVRLVAIDFDHEDLRTALSSNGDLLASRVFFIWEGVTQYLTEQGVRKTFDFLAEAAAGSSLAFTYVRRDFLEGTSPYRWESGYKRFVATKVWRFGLEPDAVADFLAEYGWGLIEDVGYEELARRYIAPTRRGLVSTPLERIVYAEKLGQ